MWIVVLWQPLPSIHDEFIEWFRGEFLPGMLESPELLRTRVFKLDHASVVSDRKHATVDKESMYQYMTLWEFDSEELPWEVLIYLGSSERWRYYAEGKLLVCCDSETKAERMKRKPSPPPPPKKKLWLIYANAQTELANWTISGK